jgi:hypothetical protein
MYTDVFETVFFKQCDTWGCGASRPLHRTQPHDTLTHSPHIHGMGSVSAFAGEPGENDRVDKHTARDH